jgi:hypothetical protein
MSSGPGGAKGLPVGRRCWSDTRRVLSDPVKRVHKGWRIARRHEGLAPQRRSLSVEEPDALIGHVRFCGGPSRVTARSTRPARTPLAEEFCDERQLQEVGCEEGEKNEIPVPHMKGRIAAVQ